MIIGSISENKKIEKRISITPDLVKKYINVGFDGLKEIYNVLGNKLLQSYDNKINVSSLASGIYTLNILTENKVNTQKITIIK